MLRWLLLLICWVQGFAYAQPRLSATPDNVYGNLFIDVQLSKIFADSKTFVDCVPKFPPQHILLQYRQQKMQPGFDLKKFVLQNFILPPTPGTYRSSSKDIRQHIGELWQVLKRSSDTVNATGSLLPLPHPYIVPGGRFREIYYWDSYFTMLGLKESGEYTLMENMVNNFAHLVRQYGHIPNGNRTYYLSRSQPPFFSLMLELLASVKGDALLAEYFDVLAGELDYWEKTAAHSINKVPAANESDTSVFLSAYTDELFIPRQESYDEDHLTAGKAVLDFFQRVRFADSNKLKKAGDSVYRLTCNNLRSAAASGWDFSSRWMKTDQLFSTRTTTIAPVDLNMLTHHLRHVYNSSKAIKENRAGTALLHQSSLADAGWMRQYFFNEDLGWYCDYDMETKQVMSNPTLAGMFPLFFKMADKKDVPRIVAFLKKHFLKAGGVVTSLNTTGQQWDAPNGWAPLQWITIIGLENYGYHDLAKEIALRWVTLNKKVFNKTGRLMEKYDVVDLTKPSGGGEYPSQDGFGWTNGVLLALMNKYAL